MLVAIFIVGYLLITMERAVRLDKAAFALMTGVICWLFYAAEHGGYASVENHLVHTLAEIAQLVFFLLGAMAIVELIEAHKGFNLIISSIRTRDKRVLLVIISIVAFLLSAAIDNLTTAIVMTSIVKRLITTKQERLLFLSMIIISSNAGGAWSPIGDVTTTMLWIKGNITPLPTVTHVIFPSLICLLIPLLLIGRKIKGKVDPSVLEGVKSTTDGKVMFFAGLGVLLLIPAFKTITHFPPFMGMLLGLSLVWALNEILHRREDDEKRSRFSVVSALQRADMPSMLFFTGILLAVSTLTYSGVLEQLGFFLNQHVGNYDGTGVILGLISAIVDNVPLVSAAMNMYSLESNHEFWQMLAYSAGTGGSCLVIGSAAGVAVMGLESEMSFFWYLRHASIPALAGFLSGAVLLFL